MRCARRPWTWRAAPPRRWRGPAAVGEHLGVEADGERVVTHLFSCLDPGYRGWRWAVTVARASRARTVTVDETLLVPGPEAILAPPWVPWRERVRPGDLGAGDILPAAPDDERLVPTAVLEGDDGVEDLTTIASQLASLAESAVAASAATEHVGLVRARTVRDRPRRGGAALVHRRARAAEPAGPPGAGAVPHLRVFRPPERPARAGLRGLRQQLRARRRPGGLGGSRVRRALGGAAADGRRRRSGRSIDELGYDLVDVPGVSVEETVFESLEPGSG